MSRNTRGRRRSEKSKKNFSVVFEDKHFMVCWKSSGLLTVPIPNKSSKNLKDILDDYLTSQKRRAHVVHRIDRYTTGLVVFAKTPKAKEKLVEQFKARTPERTYLAIVRGLPEPPEGTLRHRLMLTKDGFRQRVVRSGGTEAVTHYRVVEDFGEASLLEVKLETGLKNQIRIQFTEAGHPLVGDSHYEPTEATEVNMRRQALHAWKLAFFHPATNKKVHFEAELAPDMERLLKKLRKKKAPNEEGM